MTLNVKITEVTVCALPESSVNHHHYAVQVAYRGEDLYAVMHMGWCLGLDGTWEYEPSPSGREDDWLASHRFDYFTAYRLALRHAPDVEVNGTKARDAR
jgi:hypothetical protein